MLLEPEGMKLVLSGQSRALSQHHPSQRLSFIYLFRDQAGFGSAAFWVKQ